ncbi:HAD family hydrolase [Shewanella xiamenensis]|uniref:HAD family hydrolase n=1 Tax=Shewanella xiamenensis TaxID=332186 RepID=UPI0024A6E558|nr:HAD-IA family hydrolase [Shewanella xiamenensis]MDI5836514.1 HAD-IA family hydrolase [Shewanella xiamenensis]MDI5840755.1 HAD-IA family hydrolase [Shewanella xiamenensis]MDI5844754.1 HAD-IA family hydrolase [Shewanella xiamenensis]MDI5848713.1 HAD-IA family hydrolase [Shewanella xiamenensis]MDI5852601.1 HAD-IA family hydrolase [Shewanella xiamenensis]
MKVNNQYVWVFDLDDTLYSELEYQKSGYKAIADFVRNVYKQDVEQVIETAINNKQDVLNEICNSLNVPLSVKDSFLWLYRLHFPQIRLYNGVLEALSMIESNSVALSIITDGRSVSQRLKVLALGLDCYEVLISEDWQELKPQPERFHYIQNKYPNAYGFIYVGDNLKKDFITPNQLGWITIGLKDVGNNIHKQKTDLVDACYLPKIWIDSFTELQEFLC